MTNLKVVHWNCFKLTEARIFQFELFLNSVEPDIFSIQEIKLNEAEANFKIRFPKYATYIKTRNKNSDKGGGICILIKSNIPHILLDININLEIIGLRLEVCKDFFINFFSYYSPPSQPLSYETILELAKGDCEVLIVGDLNSRTPVVGCRSSNPNGRVLENILSDTNLVVFNDSNPTYFKFGSEYEEILDLILGSISLRNKIKEFSVLVDHLMGSDHAPILCDLTLGKVRVILETEREERLNLAKANWPFFKQLLFNKAKFAKESEINLLNVDDLNELVSGHIKDAAKLSIPYYLNQSSKTFPKEILDLIEKRRILRKSKKKFNEKKSEYNNFTYQIRISIKNI